MAEEFWEKSPFGENSIFHPSWEDKQKQSRLQAQQNGEIVGIFIDKGDHGEKLLKNSIVYDNLDPAKYRPPIYNPAPIESGTEAIIITISVTFKGNIDSLYISVNQNKQRATKQVNKYSAVFSIEIPKKEGKKQFEITAQITNFIGNETFDTKKIKVTIDLSGSELAREDAEVVSGGNWFVNNKTGEYTWFDDKTKRDGFTRVGNYKVIYNKDKNSISAYAGKESVFIEAIDMSKNNEDKFKTEQAAKFSLISAESGGGYVHSTDDPIIFPLIVGASIENRLSLYALGVTQYSPDGTIQTIKGYQAMSEDSYKDFKLGNKKRFGLGESAYEKKNMNIGLSTVYLAALGSIRYLNENYSVPKGKVKEFEQILFYAHIPPPGKKNTLNGDFDVAIPDGTSGKYDYVRGQNKHKDKLKPNK